MKYVKIFLASAALLASFGASATLTGGAGGGTGTFLALASPGACGACTLGGTVATISGGSIFTADQPFADIPKGSLFGNNFLAAGPTPGNPSTMTFTSSLDYISFLWGSPDTYNTLTVVTTAGSTNFTTVTLGLPGDGNQAFSQYVQFSTSGGEHITGLIFSSASKDAFETANFSITTAVPEPETYALMLAGLGALAFVARRRKTR
ncbi:MAG TPA: PEP-CTERM sorting domain-containing protein [Burkholderiaceae bacterium]|nr:PEP-CTERM sorting domain-containing protein [Burkholderiaceae bacterium]